VQAQPVGNGDFRRGLARHDGLEFSIRGSGGR